ncbi:MAG: hypothetical protein QOJ40_130 [Verrucomicrobiota bacterium]
MFASFEFVAPLADLLLDFFRHEINGRVEVALMILSEEVRPRNRKAHRARELPFRRLGLVMFKGDPRIDRPAVQVVQLVNAAHQVVFDGLGQRHVVGRKDQIHILRMQPVCDKIQ